MKIFYYKILEPYGSYSHADTAVNSRPSDIPIDSQYTSDTYSYLAKFF